jgi:ATP-dependent DNA ligase
MKLYKKDTKGRIRVLELTTINDKLIQESGLIKGKMTISIRTCSPKNVGKKNATTGATQAVAEMLAKSVKKLTEGYFLTQLDAETIEVIKPMLAKSFKDEEHKVVYPCYVQPKLDGMRCLAFINGRTVKLMSRENKEITTMDHLKDQLITIGKLYDDPIILDGELYAHGKTFQENMKLLKSYKKGESELVKFNVYDVVKDKPYQTRLKDLKKIFTKSFTHIKVVETRIVRKRSDIDDYNIRFLEEGYEGTMVRHSVADYKVGGRSDSLLKFKDFIDVALPVIDIVESSRVPGQGIVVVEFDGHRSKTGSKLSHSDRADLWTNRSKYIGVETAEIRYFELTDKGALRFPVFYGFRIDK